MVNAELAGWRVDRSHSAVVIYPQGYLACPFRKFEPSFFRSFFSLGGFRGVVIVPIEQSFGCCFGSGAMMRAGGSMRSPASVRCWGKDRLGSISKQGDRYLRSLFMAGALAVIRYAKINGTEQDRCQAIIIRSNSRICSLNLRS
jgi:hypothetical protein